MMFVSSLRNTVPARNIHLHIRVSLPIASPRAGAVRVVNIPDLIAGWAQEESVVPGLE